MKERKIVAAISSVLLALGMQASIAEASAVEEEAVLEESIEETSHRYRREQASGLAFQGGTQSGAMTVASPREDSVKPLEWGPDAKGTYAAIAIGQGANGGRDSVSIGYQTLTTDPDQSQNTAAVALGNYAEVKGRFGMALGYVSKAEAEGATAVGSFSSASGVHSVVLGRGANSSAEGSIAAGYKASAEATGAVALGSGSLAQEANVVSVGSDTLKRKVVNVARGVSDFDAVNMGQLNETNQRIDFAEIGSGASSVRIGTVAVGDNSKASAIRATAVGMNANAYGDNTVVVGQGATASSAQGIAIGSAASVGGHASVAIGYFTKLGDGATNSVALGARSETDEQNVVSVGAPTRLRKIVNMAAGVADMDAVNMGQLNATNTRVHATETSVSNVSQGRDGIVRVGGDVIFVAPGASGIDALAIGSAASVEGARSMAIGNQSGVTSAADGVAVGYGSLVGRAGWGDSATAVGANARATGGGSTVLGAYASSDVYDASVVGSRAKATGSSGTAIGAYASVSGYNSVALGANSVADKQGIVSVGSADFTRKIVRVSAGDISAASTDVVNGSQLHSTNIAVEALEGKFEQNQSAIEVVNDALAQVVTYDSGEKDAVTLGAGAGGVAVKLKNVAAGVADTDAVNLGQLKSVGDSVGALSERAVQYDDEVGNGRASVTFGGAASSDGGKTGGTRLKNVAQGDVSALSTDAVNGAQLHAVSVTLSNLGDAVHNVENGGGIRYFQANGGTTPMAASEANGVGSTAMGPSARANGESTVALGNGAVASQAGDVAIGAGAVADRGAAHYTGKYSGAENRSVGTVAVGSVGAERTIGHVADGVMATDAVNMRQLDGAVAQAKSYTDQRITAVSNIAISVGEDLTKLDARVTKVEGDVTRIDGDLTSLRNGTTGMFRVNSDEQTTAAPAASGRNSVAGGSGATASGEKSSALGSNSLAVGKNAVALGAGSVADRDDSVSVGREGGERQIVNVAPGVAGTDAVNVNQLRELGQGLNQQVAGVRNDMQRMDSRMSAGIAAAMAVASLPQPYRPGKSMVAIGGATWRGETGVAIGVSTISRNGEWIVKGNATSTSRGDYGASVGVGFQW